MLYYDEFRRLCENAWADLYSHVPNIKTRGHSYINAYGNWQRGSTGNMQQNATKIRFFRGFNCKLYIDDNIAPYVPYTNEKWVSPKWRGHKNPNEGWFDRAAYAIAKNIARDWDGELVE